jgi:malonate-semialdehyde dehydrogenase (acetylating)/methylmalonate-semialdehyde dehydrogenase
MDLTTLERLPLWIGGKAVAAQTKRYGEITNPATGEVIRHVPLANAADVDAAVAAAAAALPGWRATPSLRRARILMRFRELMECIARTWRRSSRRSTARRTPMRKAR